ncbi:MAG: hypothetical protein QXK37_04485 [Candidatus Woesearchaeota archaeon]
MQKIILTHVEPNLNADSKELADIIIKRLGLMPRKIGSTEKMNNVLIELYERTKIAAREKNPTKAVITVEEMGLLAGITRQTMYEYLRRWTDLDLIVKTSFIDTGNKVIVGYRLNGPTLEAAFEKAKARISNNLDITLKYIRELQKLLKNEKISQKLKSSATSISLQRDHNIINKDEIYEENIDDNINDTVEDNIDYNEEKIHDNIEDK